jgi:hypothetical protein
MFLLKYATVSYAPVTYSNLFVWETPLSGELTSKFLGEVPMVDSKFLGDDN